MRDISLTDGVLVETLGDTVIVMTPGKDGVVTLEGELATIVRNLQAGTPVSATTAGVSELVDLGIVQGSPNPSRRSVLRVGAIGAGAGIAALAMPSVAAASSPGGGDPQPVGLFVFRATDPGPRWEFLPQPFSLATEVNDFVTGGGISTLTLATGQTTANWVVEEFRLPGSDPTLFGESIEGTWTLGPGITRTQTFNRQRSGSTFT